MQPVGELTRQAKRSLAWLPSQVDEEERRLLVQALVVGAVVWAFVYVLKAAVHAGFGYVTELLHAGPSHWVVLAPLAVGALGVAAIAHRARRTVVHFEGADGKLHALNTVEGDGLERAIALYFASEPTSEKALLGEQGVKARWRLPTFSLALKKMAATWLTLVSCGAGGLEASVALVGESTAAGLFKPRPAVDRVNRHTGLLARAWRWWCATQPEDLQSAQLCGISAAIATLLGTPFAAAFFAIEVMYRRRPIVDRLIYALASALVAFFLNHVAGAEGIGLGLPESVEPPLFSARYYGALLTTAVSVSILAFAFRAARVWMDGLFHRRPLVVRHVTGALATGVIASAVASALAYSPWADHVSAYAEGPLSLLLGTGEAVIAATLAGELPAALAGVVLAARFFATLTTITSGGSAGLLFPTLCFGALVATAWAGAFGLPAGVLVAPAMTASLVSIVNVPLAAILFVIEAFGAEWTVPALFALVTASLFAHKNSLYRAQRERFDDRQLLPGISVRRIRVPSGWDGMTLTDLGIRQRFGLTVIGTIDRSNAPDGGVDERVVLNPRPDHVLTTDDLLIVLGEEERLERFEQAGQDASARLPAETLRGD